MASMAFWALLRALGLKLNTCRFIKTLATLDCRERLADRSTPACSTRVAELGGSLGPKFALGMGMPSGRVKELRMTAEVGTLAAAAMAALSWVKTASLLRASTNAVSKGQLLPQLVGLVSNL